MPLISAEELAGRLRERGLAVLEVGFVDDDANFRAAHVPGARWAHWKRLLWHETDRELADAATLASRLGELGIPGGATIVLVGDPIQFATYAFWVLHMRGWAEVRVLDGGRAGALKESSQFGPQTRQHLAVRGIGNQVFLLSGIRFQIV